MLGEEQELDLSPRKQRLGWPVDATGEPSEGCGVAQRKLTYSPPLPSQPPSLTPRRRTSPTPTSSKQESSDGELSSGMSTISDMSREPLSIDTGRRDRENETKEGKGEGRCRDGGGRKRKAGKAKGRDGESGRDGERWGREKGEQKVMEREIAREENVKGEKEKTTERVRESKKVEKREGQRKERCTRA